MGGFGFVRLFNRQLFIFPFVIGSVFSLFFGSAIFAHKPSIGGNNAAAPFLVPVDLVYIYEGKPDDQYPMVEQTRLDQYLRKWDLKGAQAALSGADSGAGDRLNLILFYLYSRKEAEASVLLNQWEAEVGAVRGGRLVAVLRARGMDRALWSISSIWRSPALRFYSEASFWFIESDHQMLLSVFSAWKGFIEENGASEVENGIYSQASLALVGRSGDGGGDQSYLVGLAEIERFNGGAEKKAMMYENLLERFGEKYADLYHRYFVFLVATAQWERLIVLVEKNRDRFVISPEELHRMIEKERSQQRKEERERPVEVILK